MRILVLLVISFFLSSSVLAQQIQILEFQSKEPITGVAIFNTDASKSGVSDFDGFVDISKFSETDKITFQHISHVSRVLTKSEIENDDNKVYLEVNASSLDEIVLSVSKFGQKKKRHSTRNCECSF